MSDDYVPERAIVTVDGVKSWLTPKVRKTIYDVLIMLLSMSAVVGLITNEDKQLFTTWIDLTIQVIGAVGLAVARLHVSGIGNIIAVENNRK